MSRHSNITRFSVLFADISAQKAFRDPAHLLDWLHSQGGDSEQRNTVLRKLHCAAVEDPHLSSLATELLILALWPGICLVRGRLRGLIEMTQLDADLISGLTMGILQSDPQKVARVAATLLRNLERDLRRAHCRNNRLVLSDTVDEAADRATADDGADRPEPIMKAAAQQLGDDGLLLALVHVVGFSQKDAARGLGITHEAARKRCQRAFARLRNTLEE